MTILHEAESLAKQMQDLLQPQLPENVEITIEYFQSGSMGQGGNINCRSDWELAQELNE